MYIGQLGGQYNHSQLITVKGRETPNALYPRNQTSMQIEMQKVLKSVIHELYRIEKYL